jgi:hypothetical protein
MGSWGGTVTRKGWVGQFPLPQNQAAQADGYLYRSPQLSLRW